MKLLLTSIGVEVKDKSTTHLLDADITGSFKFVVSDSNPRDAVGNESAILKAIMAKLGDELEVEIPEKV
jgi:hypothetical protein